MRQEELGCAGGFFDGEGTVVIVRHNRKSTSTENYMLVVALYQNKRKPLELFEKIVGVKGSIYGPKSTGVYHWRVRNRKAMETLDVLGPHLRVKKAHVEVARDFQLNLRPPDHTTLKGYSRRKLTKREVETRRRLARKMSKLNGRKREF